MEAFWIVAIRGRFVPRTIARSRYRSTRGEVEIRHWCERRLDEWSVAHERHNVATVAGRTHLVVAGSGPRVVLYLPGTNFNAATSLALATALASYGRVVVADLPGQPGLSAGTRPEPDRVGMWAGELVDWVKSSRGGVPLILAGHSLGAAVALAAPTAGVDALVLLDPAGLVRARVSGTVLRSTLPWLIHPDERRSRTLLKLMSAPGHEPSPTLVEWLTLVARHTRPSAAPGPLPPAVTARWWSTPRTVLSGEHDGFFDPARLRPPVRSRLGVELREVRGAGHLTVEDDPAGAAAAIAAASL